MEQEIIKLKESIRILRNAIIEEMDYVQLNGTAIRWNKLNDALIQSKLEG